MKNSFLRSPSANRTPFKTNPLNRHTPPIHSYTEIRRCVSVLSRIKWLSFSIELFLAVPIFGNIAGDAIPFLLCLIALWHASVLYISKTEDQPILGSALGVIASFLNFFPIIRLIAHAITAIVLIFEIQKAPGME